MHRTTMRMGMLGAAVVLFGTAGAGVASAGSAIPVSTGPVAPQARAQCGIHDIQGEVTAVDPGGKSITIKDTEGTMPPLVRADIAGTTTIRQGWFHRTPADLKVGSDVDMMYERSGGKWVADRIRILDPLVSAKGIEGPDVS